jgi:hypothetical protein
MASYKTDQKVFVTKTFILLVVPVQKQYLREFSVRVAPSRDTIYWLMKQF